MRLQLVLGPSPRVGELHSLRDGARHEDPELNAEQEAERQKPVSSRRWPVVSITPHWEAILTDRRDGSCANIAQSSWVLRCKVSP
jgi:hypothetical protein